MKIEVPQELATIIIDVLAEYDKATRRFGEFASVHEVDHTLAIPHIPERVVSKRERRSSRPRL